MAAFLNIDDALFIDLRPGVIIPLGRQRQRGKYIQRRHSPGRLLDPLHLGGHRLADFCIDLVLQRIKLIFRAQDHVFQFFEFRRDIALGVGKGLFSRIIIRHHIFIGIGHFQIVAEYFVVFDPQVLDARLFPLFILQLRQPVFAVGFGAPELIHLFIVPVPDDIAFFHGDGRILPDRVRDQAAEVFQRIQVLTDLFQQAASHILKDEADGRQHLKRRPKCRQIPGIGRPVGDPGDQTLQVIDRPHIFPQLLPGYSLLFQFLHRIQPALDLRLLDQRLLHIFSERPGAHGRLRLVQHPEEGAPLLLFPERLAQFQVPPGRTVQHHVFPGCIGRDVGQV